MAFVDPGAALDALRDHVITPVIREASTDRARTVVDTLRDAGFRVFEITLSVPGALDLVAELASEADLIVGVGTVFRRQEARLAVDVGARFVVSPTADPAVASAAREGAAAAVLGALTPTEVVSALAAGADAVKLFPASSVGGPSHVKALRSVFPDVPFIPTGGVDLSNIHAYLAAGVHSVGVGGALSPSDLRTLPSVARAYRAAAIEPVSRLGGSRAP